MTPEIFRDRRKNDLLVVLNLLGLNHFLATVVTVGADVMTPVGLTGGGLHGQGGLGQGIVRTTHVPARRALSILLNGHCYLLILNSINA